MFKKRLILIGAVVVLIVAILIPPVRAAAESALSVFRVGNAHTITVTADDLKEMADYLKSNTDLMKHGAGEQPEAGGAQRKADMLLSQVKTLGSVREFTAFPFSLPSALKSETPKLSAVGSTSKTVTLDTAKLNAALSKLGGTASVDAGLSGTVITVTTPAAIAAEYQDVLLLATQNVSVDAPDAALKSLRAAVLSVPAIPGGLRAQLLAIDPKTRDIYLPVIEGFGRETDLGSTTGYIYASGDLAQVLAMLPQTAGSEMLTQLQGANKSALVWTKNGVLYCLAGDKTDSELTQIARSMR